MSEDETLSQLTLFVEDFHAKTCPLPEGGRDLLESGADYGSSLRELLMNLSRSGLLRRMSPVFYRATEDEILPSSFMGWSNSGMAFAGGCLTLSISESPSAAVVCSLSGVLETDAPPKYYLSARACAGILKRSVRRGKLLPRYLQAALERVAWQAREAKASS